MPIEDEWRRGYARQAWADLKTREMLSGPAGRDVPECHRLHFLQMACEKLVKAHLYFGGSPPGKIQSSHAVIAKHLPIIVNEYYRRQKGQNLPHHLMARVRSLSREIELLAPAVDNAGLQPANCEYPWLDTATRRVFVPVDYGFRNLDLPREVAGRLILKIMPVAIAALSEPT